MSTPAEDDAMLRANCWVGKPVEGRLSASALKWAAGTRAPPRKLLAPPKIDYDDWSHPEVGWGIVLPERSDLSAEAKSLALDAPDAIQELVRQRGNAPVLRYDPKLAAQGLLRRYERGTNTFTQPGPRGKRGSAPGLVPHYLLIVGSPDQIPWEFQYQLQTEAFVGRLDLDDTGLENYVNALLRQWSGSERDVTKPVVWSVDHGHPDITRLMAKTIGERLSSAFASDAEFDHSNLYLTGSSATSFGLVDAISKRKPAFLATTSHGATFPLNQPVALAQQLGIPVDANHDLLSHVDVLSNWNSEGAIWYAHACCSAGASGVSAFEGLIDPSTELGKTVLSLGVAGEISAPLPKMMLGHAKPLGAFVGHVEPTFNWTLFSTSNKQTTTAHIIQTLYNQLHGSDRPTIGRSLHGYYQFVAGLLLLHGKAVKALNSHAPGAAGMAIRSKLIATDLLSMVLLGDPTVRLPRPAG